MSPGRSLAQRVSRGGSARDGGAGSYDPRQNSVTIGEGRAAYRVHAVRLPGGLPQFFLLQGQHRGNDSGLLTAAALQGRTKPSNRKKLPPRTLRI